MNYEPSWAKKRKAQGKEPLFARDAVHNHRDPTGTSTLRSKFWKDMAQRWRKAERLVREAIVTHDILGTKQTVVSMAQGSDKAILFQRWFDNVLQHFVVANRVWLSPYIRDASALAEKRAVTMVGDTSRTEDFIQTLITITLADLQGVCDATLQQSVRSVGSSLLAHRKPGQIANDITAIMKKVGEVRSAMVVNHMVVKTFAASTLESFRAAGHTHVGTIAETLPHTHVGDAARKTPQKRHGKTGKFVAYAKPSSAKNQRKAERAYQLLQEETPEVDVMTAEDDLVCVICERISDNGPYEIDHALELIPAHPNCRCVFVVSGQLPMEDENPYHEPAGSSKGGEFASGPAEEDIDAKYDRATDALYTFDITRKAFATGVWWFKRVADGVPNGVVSFNILPDKISEDFKPIIGSDGDPTGWAVPNSGQLAANNPVPETGKPETIYRGMSFEEYNSAKISGFITSNFANAPQLLPKDIMFTNNPRMAQRYASEAAPWPYRATPTRPAYVVAVRYPGVDPTSADVAIDKQTIPWSDVTEVYRGDVVSFNRGLVTVNADLTEGPSMPYTSKLAWARIYSEKAETDDWNRQTGIRLEKEYQDARPALYELVKETEGKDVTVVVEDWNSLSEEQQDLVKSDWVDSTKHKYYEQEVNYWYTDSAQNEAKEKLVDDFNVGKKDWAKKTIEEYQSDIGNDPIPLSTDQLLNAVEILYDPDDSIIKFSINRDKILPDPNQLVLPGIKPISPADSFTKEMEISLKTLLKVNAKVEAQNIRQELPRPDYLVAAGAERQEHAWDEMADYGKWGIAKEYLADPDTNLIRRQTALEIPTKYDPIGDIGTKDDYKKTQTFAKYISIARAKQILRARMGKDYSLEAIKTVDDWLWKDWINSSAGSPGGRILQVAVSDELKGRLNIEHFEYLYGGYDHDASYYIKRDADEGGPSKIGGYEAVKALVRAKWETAQWMLEKAGLDKLQLYRAIDIKESLFPDRTVQGYAPIPDLTVKRNGAASTSYDRGVPNSWGNGKNRVVLRAVVPRTAAVSVPAFGNNYQEEKEIVIAGTAWDGWDAWKDRAPSFKEIPLRTPDGN